MWQPLHPLEAALGRDRGNDGDVVWAVQGGDLDDQRGGDAVDEFAAAVHAQHVGSEVDGDGNVAEPIDSFHDADRLSTKGVVSVTFDIDGERHHVVAEADPDPQEVGCVPAALPQVDRAHLGMPNELGEVWSAAETFGALVGPERFELTPPLEQHRSERTDLAAEVAASCTTIIDGGADHDDRRDECEQEELGLARHRVHRDAGEQWGNDGDQLEASGLGPPRERAHRLGLAVADHRWSVRRAMEVDLRQTVEALGAVAAEALGPLPAFHRGRAQRLVGGRRAGRP